MTAIREFTTIKNHELRLQIPEEFDYEEVEVVIMPKHDARTDTQDTVSNEELQALSNHSASTVEEWMDEDDVWN
jgi:hypothetical protein